MPVSGQTMLMLGVLVVNPMPLVVSAATTRDAAPPGGAGIVVADRAFAAARAQDAASPTIGISVTDTQG